MVVICFAASVRLCSPFTFVGLTALPNKLRTAFNPKVILNYVNCQVVTFSIE